MSWITKLHEASYAPHRFSQSYRSSAPSSTVASGRKEPRDVPDGSSSVSPTASAAAAPHAVASGHLAPVGTCALTRAAGLSAWPHPARPGPFSLFVTLRSWTFFSRPDSASAKSAPHTGLTTPWTSMWCASVAKAEDTDSLSSSCPTARTSRTGTWACGTESRARTPALFPNARGHRFSTRGIRRMVLRRALMLAFEAARDASHAEAHSCNSAASQRSRPANRPGVPRTRVDHDHAAVHARVAHRSRGSAPIATPATRDLVGRRSSSLCPVGSVSRRAGPDGVPTAIARAVSVTRLDSLPDRTAYGHGRVATTLLTDPIRRASRTLPVRGGPRVPAPQRRTSHTGDFRAFWNLIVQRLFPVVPWHELPRRVLLRDSPASRV